jgi:FKBP-type peptidyl-prolyl cis-trans isomerase
VTRFTFSEFGAVFALVLASAGCTTAEEPQPKEESVTKPTEKKYDTKAETKQATPPRGPQVPAPSDVAAPPPDAQKTDSGLAYEVLQAGDGETKPGKDDIVAVEYTGWTTDGVTFDTTQQKGAQTFPVAAGIEGWAEGLQLMSKGAKHRLWIPEDLAYKGRKGRPAGMLVFDVELLDIVEIPDTPADVAAPPADAKKTKGGVSYKILAEGEGSERPRPWDKVTVNYSGWTTDGKMFDSSYKSGKPIDMPLSSSIEGWKEGIPQMTVGDKMRLWVPEELAYQGKPGRPAGMLVFDVELLEVEQLPEPPPPPKTPKNVAKPPASAKKTESGLAYEVLEKGGGGDHPGPQSRVTVHYTGWTTDGKMFDSSVVKGREATLSLRGVIPGWTEGMQLMTKGAKYRFWIPEELAYKGRPGAPAGMLVFDVELIDFQ